MVKYRLLTIFFLIFPLYSFAKKPIFELVFSLNSSNDSPKGKAALYFKKRVEELTKSDVVVKIYSNSELYKDSNVLPALKIDKVHIAAPSFSKFLKDIPQLNLFELPFLFSDLTHVYNALNSEVGKKLKEYAYEEGYIVLSFWDKGFKQLTSSKQAIIYPADLAKQSIRIRGLRVLNRVYRALGAYPKVLPYQSVYKKLKSKEIDGQENTITEIYNMQFYKRQKYLTISNHGYLGYMVVMNKSFWNTLPAYIKEAIVKSMNEATLKQRMYAKSDEDKDLQRISNYAKLTGGLSIISDLNDKQKDSWFIEAKKVYPLFYDEDDTGKELIDKVLELR